jgi:hypothetical protein
MEYIGRHERKRVKAGVESSIGQKDAKYEMGLRVKA